MSPVYSKLVYAELHSPHSTSAAGKVGVIHSFCLGNLATTLTLWLTLIKTSGMCEEVIQHNASSPQAISVIKECGS